MSGGEHLQDQALLDQILTCHRNEPGGLLPVLRDLQDGLGFVPEESYLAIAEALNISVAEVHGVVSFYHDFRTEPAGACVIQVCQAESCQACGSRELTAHAEQRLGVALGETRADGAVTLEPVYCLGNCACSPAIAIDQQSHALVDKARFDALTTQWAQESDT
ncbi:formate dehydrogenase [Halioglobus sp. HI00S01]|nr:formate dehydrogenase [Halioglobus sp. HI00S01]